MNFTERQLELQKDIDLIKTTSEQDCQQLEEKLLNYTESTELEKLEELISTLKKDNQPNQNHFPNRSVQLPKTENDKSKNSNISNNGLLNKMNTSSIGCYV